MNCQELESILGDLVRDSTRDPGLWRDAGLHLADCPGCSARMSRERTLQALLDELASTAREVNAPVRLEASLLDAFRKEKARRQDSGRLVSRVPIWAGWRWVLAGVTLAVLVISLAWLIPPEKPEVPVVHGPHDPVTTPPTAIPHALGSEASKIAVVAQSVAPVNASNQLARKQRARKEGDKIQKIRPPVRPERPVNPTPDLPVESESEIATDFLPFMAVDNNFLGGQRLLRVKLPRYTLEAFGLPLNRERAREPIDADVLVGDDGLVRAIRFVH
jgi:hypothetical protein